MLTKAEVRRMFRSLLALHGFTPDGNYYRRQSGDALQALYLEPSRHGHAYFPEMLVTYRDLNSTRKNVMADCHLRARLSLYYHPDGDPRVTPRQEWVVPYDEPVDASELRAQAGDAIEAFLTWLREYPTWQVRSEEHTSELQS